MIPNERPAETTVYERLDKVKDPLIELNGVIDWSLFEEDLRALREKLREIVADKAGRVPSPAGRKSFDPVMMFKVLILQALNNLSGEATEFQIRDRLSFQRFLGLGFSGTVPDAKTIRLFREQLVKANLVKLLFDRFDARLRERGLSARRGRIVDAAIVRVPARKSIKEKAGIIAGGKVSENGSPQEKRRKDTEVCEMKKNCTAAVVNQKRSFVL
jgi:transposase